MRRKCSKKALAFALVAALSFGSIAAPANCVKAANQINYYSDTTDIASEYTIGSVREMNQFAQLVNAGNDFEGVTVKLTADIAFNGITADNYIGCDYFSGTFDGCGHTISGIYKTKASYRSGDKYSGLFSRISSSGVVKNLTISNSTFDLTDNNGYVLIVGAIAGDNAGIIDNCRVSNVTIKGNSEDGAFVGGVAGAIDYDSYYGGSGKIVNCMVLGGSIEGGYVGGISGIAKGKINNCSNSSSVSATIRAGGIAGYVNEMTNCYNTGKVTNSNTSNENNYTGGMAGYAKNATNNYCSNESCEYDFGYIEVASSSNKAYEDSYMKTGAFKDILNATVDADTSDELLSWEFRAESVYPVIENLVDMKKTVGSLTTAKLYYTGAQVTPAVSVKYGDKILIEGKDYTKKYINNINAGTGTVTITGKNRYVGSISLNFIINKANQKMSVKKSYNVTYSGRQIPLTVNRTFGPNTAMTYKSANTKVAKVSANGVLTLVAPGKTTIKVSSPANNNFNSTSRTITITVKPAKSSISATAGKKSMKLRWKKSNKATGYELQYSTYSNFKKSVKTINIKKSTIVSKTIKNLKTGKKYYVRIRAYKTIKVNGKTTKLYSSWSTKKSVKIK